MPNRIIKESICTSENIDQLTPLQEVIFYRLMVNCDDYGRMDARAKILISRLFPLREISADEITDAMQALADADLIIKYEVGGKPYIQMKTWERHQQVRAKKSKYPSPYDSSCNQLISDDSKCSRNPIQSNPIQSEEKNKATPSPESFIGDLEAIELSGVHDEIFNTMQRAGFQMNDRMRDVAMELLQTHGREKLLYAIEQCVGATGNKLNYLRKVLANYGKPKPGEDDAQADVKKAWDLAKQGW